MLLAKNLGIPTLNDYNPLLEEARDLILELTGDPRVREKILRNKHPHTQDYRPY